MKRGMRNWTYQGDAADSSLIVRMLKARNKKFEINWIGDDTFAVTYRAINDIQGPIDRHYVAKKDRNF